LHYQRHKDWWKVSFTAKTVRKNLIRFPYTKQLWICTVGVTYYSKIHLNVITFGQIKIFDIIRMMTITGDFYLVLYEKWDAWMGLHLGADNVHLQFIIHLLRLRYKIHKLRNNVLKIKDLVIWIGTFILTYHLYKYILCTTEFF